MNIEQVKLDFSNEWSGYQHALTTALATNNPLLLRINEYIVKHAGKQLRPILSLLAASACGEVNSKNFYCAAVSEMVHTATLLHDDVSDNGNIRRGAATVKALFGDAASVLTGDYWLSRALKSLTDECSLSSLACFTLALGELSEGELLQMEKSLELNTTKEDYYTIIHYKTASLFIAAMKSAVCSLDNAPKEYLEAVESYAYYLGLAFQIRDDIFDYSPKIDSGKLSGADICERKITLPLLLALEVATESERSEVIRLIGEIDPLAIKARNGETTSNEKEILEYVNSFVAKHDGITLSQRELESHVVKAKEALEVLPNSKAKDYLCEIVEYVGQRTY